MTWTRRERVAVKYGQTCFAARWKEQTNKRIVLTHEVDELKIDFMQTVEISNAGGNITYAEVMDVGARSIVLRECEDGK